MSYIGLDLGTSGLRALLVDRSGAPIGAAQANYDAAHPHSGWSEQDPADWVGAIKIVFDDLRARFREFSDLRGIGVAGHMHGATLLDEQGDVLRPCILWNDTRAAKQAKALDNLEQFRQVTGNVVFPGFTAPKLNWVRDHEPQIFAKLARVLLPAAYLNYVLTGQFVGDLSDASGTSWLNVGARDWSDDLLSATGLRRDHMPQLFEGCQPAAHLRDDLKKRFGLTQDVIVAGGAGDNAAAACGIGALREGQGFVSLGTSGVILAARDGYVPDADRAVHTFCHALPQRWYQMGVMLAATDSLNWLSKITSQPPQVLTEKLGDALRPPSNIKFLPYLSGERTPHNDADIRGAFLGLSSEHDVVDLTAAVLQGVCFGLRDSVVALQSTGVTLPRLMAIGGGTGSKYWLKLLATIFNMPIDIPDGGEFGAALGAARLAIVACGHGAIDEVMTAPKIRETILPDPDLVTEYDAAYYAFRAAYSGVKSVQ